jgi:ABC-type spermidine/putrescine transport system permease subunit I
MIVGRKPEPSRVTPLFSGASRRRSWWKHSQQTAGAGGQRWFWALFAVPSLLWLGFFFVLALYIVVCVSFGTTDIFQNPVPVYLPWHWTTSWVDQTLHGFAGSNAFYLPAVLRTLVYVSIATVCCLLVGFPFAYYLARHATPRKKLFFLVVLVAPFWISYITRMYALQGLLQSGGVVNRVLLDLRLIGAPINWLDGKAVTVVGGLVYGYVPYMIIPLFGQLDRIDPALLKAARDLGANRREVLWRVLLPLARPGIWAGVVICALPMFGDYYTNDLLGSPNTSMFGNLIDTAVTNPGQGPLSAALVLILMLALLVPLLTYMRSVRRGGLIR